MKARRNVTAIILGLALTGCSSEKIRTEVQLQPYDFTYSSYAQMLAANVVTGLVDYASIKTDRTALDSLVDNIGAADLSDATDDQQLAFYINTYNILTIRSVVDAYPIESIQEIDEVWDKTWLVAGESISLNHIEHEILREQFSEPRIHVAINCASIGCPPLLDVPYYPDQMDSLLTIASLRFAASDSHNQVDFDQKTARISAVFDWFGEDFIEEYYFPDRFPDLNQKHNAALGFLLDHLPQRDEVLDRRASLAVSYLDYDWSLNDLKR